MFEQLIIIGMSIGVRPMVSSMEEPQLLAKAVEMFMASNEGTSELLAHLFDLNEDLIGQFESVN